MSQLNFFFGLGIFLFGMARLEYGIHKLGAARLRHWLRTSTGSRLGSVSTGVVTTAILQSSSMVSLLVLAFASAGLLPFVNAVGIILGANLGTTFTGWIVAIFGFKLSLDAMALPLFGLTAFVLSISKRDSRIYFVAVTLFGLALLLFGLGVMKTSMEALPEQIDIAVIQGHHPLVYLLFGVVIAALVQSSSATMMMALAALNSQFIALPEAVAVIIGADLGTTSTTVLGSLTGSPVKRQLAFAHFVYNFVVDISAFIVLLPLSPALFSMMGLADPLYSLVAFHSLMNLVGLILFLPVLNQFARWIEHLFNRGSFQSDNLLDRVPPEVTEAALVALEDTVKQLILQAACNALRIFGLKPEKLKIIDDHKEAVLGTVTHQDFTRGYEELRNQEGKILAYSVKIQTQPLEAEEVVELERLQLITRHVVFCNKNLKDIQQDLKEMKRSDADSDRELYARHKRFHKLIYEKFIDLLLGEHRQDYILDELEEIRAQNEKHTEESNHFVQSRVGKEAVEEGTVSIQLNSNREIRHAVKTLVKAINLWARNLPESTPLDAEPLKPVTSENA